MLRNTSAIHVITTWRMLTIVVLIVELALFLDASTQQVLLQLTGAHTLFVHAPYKMPVPMCLLCLSLIIIGRTLRTALWRPWHLSVIKGHRFKSVGKILGTAAPQSVTIWSIDIISNLCMICIFAIALALQASVFFFAFWACNMAVTATLYMAVARNMRVRDAFFEGITHSRFNWRVSGLIHGSITLVSLSFSNLWPQVLEPSRAPLHWSVVFVVYAFLQYAVWLVLSALYLTMDAHVEEQ